MPRFVFCKYEIGVDSFLEKKQINIEVVGELVGSHEDERQMDPFFLKFVKVNTVVYYYYFNSFFTSLLPVPF
jgi:hypothetical protein